MSNEYYTVCNDKNIILEKNDLDNYRINIDIIPNINNDFTLVDIIIEEQLWNLLYELNNDNIEEFKINNLTNSQDIFIKVKSNTEKQISKELKDIIIHIDSKYNKINEHKCQLICTNLHNSTIKFDNFIIFIDCSNLKLTNIKIHFTLLDINDFISTYIALYIKKIFYRLTKYLS